MTFLARFLKTRLDEVGFVLVPGPGLRGSSGVSIGTPPAGTSPADTPDTFSDDIDLTSQLVA